MSGVQIVTVVRAQPTQVTVAQRAPVALTPLLSPELVATQPVREEVVVTQAAAPVKQVNVPGIQGVPGPAGASGSGDATAVIPFAFGDASPRVVFTATDDRVIPSVRVVIDTAFDGVDPGIALGTAAAPELYMPYAGNDPTTAAAYESEPDIAVPANTEVLLSVRPGSGATKGTGRLLLTAYTT